MSKFFVRVLGGFYSMIDEPLYNTLEMACRAVNMRPEKADCACEIYEITTSEVKLIQTLHCYDEHVWLSEEEYKFRKSIDGGLIELRDRYLAFNGKPEKWNEWALKHNVEEKYLIK